MLDRAADVDQFAAARIAEIYVRRDAMAFRRCESAVEKRSQLPLAQVRQPILVVWPLARVPHANWLCTRLCTNERMETLGLAPSSEDGEQLRRRIADSSSLERSAHGG